MRKDKIKRRLKIATFAFLAVAFFALVAYKFRFAEFHFSIVELMLLLLSMFTLAVGLTYWQIIRPIVHRLGQKKIDTIFKV